MASDTTLGPREPCGSPLLRSLHTGPQLTSRTLNGSWTQLRTQLPGPTRTLSSFFA